MKHNPGSSRLRIASLCPALLLNAIGAGSIASAQWISVPMTTEDQYQSGSTLAEGMQFPYCMIRSVSDPDRIYWAQDVGQIWRSDDNGQSWVHPLCTGFYINGAESVQCDPADADVVLAVAANNWDYQRMDQQGIYRSTDGGNTWARAQAIDFVQDQYSGGGNRHEQHRFAWDPTTVPGPVGSRKWYCVVNREKKVNNVTTTYNPRIYRSTDGGASWSMIKELAFSAYEKVYMLKHHPAQTNILFLATSKGLFKSINGGDAWSPLNGNRPAGDVRSIEINPADADDIYATVDDLGLYRTADGGANWSLIKSYLARRVVVDPTDRNHVYLIGRQAKPLKNPPVTGGPLIVTFNANLGAGATWHKSAVEEVDGTMNNDPDGSWETSIVGEMANIVPDPRDGDVATAHAFAQIYRTTDGGLTFARTTTGFTGQSANDFWFDPNNGSRLATFNVDAGLKITNNGDWFEHRPAKTLVNNGTIGHGTMFSGSFKSAGSPVVVASAGTTSEKKLIKSTNEGVDWTTIDSTPTNVKLVRFSPTNGDILYADKRRFDGGQFVNPTALAYRVVGVFDGNGDTVFGIDSNDDGAIYKSTDKGNTWGSASFANGADVLPFDASPVFTVHPTNANVIYTCRPGGDLSKCDSGTWTPYNILAMTQIPGGPTGLLNNISQIAIDPRNPQIIVVGTRGVGQPCVFRTTNGGDDWEDITQNLPRLGAKTLGINPTTGDLYVATQSVGLYRLPANSAPDITTVSLPGGTVGFAYNQTLAANGGDGALVWSLDSGTLPAGLSLSSGGVISGTPTTAGGPTNFTARVADSDGNTGSGDEDTQGLSITIEGSGVGDFAANEDIGGPGLAGSASYNSGSGVYTVTGGGTDIYGTSDKFRFVHEPWTGDGRIIARVTAVENTHAWAKAGVMFRESTAADSKNVDLILSAGNKTQFLYRATTGGTTQYDPDAIVSGISAPYWLRLERHGDTFAGWQSPDGEMWFLTDATTFSMNAATRVGLAVTAHNDADLNTSTFDNVSMGNVPAWTRIDIGAVGATGSVSVDYTTDLHTVSGAGANIYGTADSFCFYYQALTGDATIIAAVLSVENTHANSKGGVMIRQSLTDNSPHALINMMGGDDVEFLRRLTTGATTARDYTTAGMPTPRFVKLARSGNTFAAHYLSDVGAWVQLGSPVTISMTGTIYVGLVSSSHVSGTLCASTFESVFVKQ